MRQRMINTKFWDDNYISELEPLEKLLFLYFLTNTSTTICGIYEIPLKKIIIDTGVEKEGIKKIMEKFSSDKKIFYKEGWICLKNFIKHQNYQSPKVAQGIKNELLCVPDTILKSFIGYGYGMDMISHLIKDKIIESNLIGESLLV